MRLASLFALGTIIATTLSITSIADKPAPAKAPPAAAKPQWSAKMQELSQAMSVLLPETSSTKPITSKESARKITAAAAKLKGLAHTINLSPKDSKHPVPPDADPSIPFLSSLFEREVRHAYAALENGHVEYAKGSLRFVTSYCIACHTRTDQGPNFPSLPLGQAPNKLPPFEKAQLYAATRQFDKAFDEFKNLIGDKKFAKDKQLEWGRSVRQAFTIAVRVKKDPKLAMDVVQRVEGLKKSVPPLFREYVPAWRATVQQWQQEKPRTFNTEPELYEEAQRLLKAAKSVQKYPLDHSADVLFLRLSLVAHELLSRFPQGPHTSEALYLAGNSYDLLDDHLVSPLPDMYYEACIRRSPHSTVSEDCYKRYEANVNFGYTGSSGTAIPEDLKELLDELKKLAEPAAKTTGS